MKKLMYTLICLFLFINISAKEIIVIDTSKEIFNKKALVILNGFGDYKIIVHKDGIVDKNGNQMSEDLTINYNISQN